MALLYSKIDVFPLQNYILQLDPGIASLIKASAHGAGSGSAGLNRRDGRGGNLASVNKALANAIAERRHKTVQEQVIDLRNQYIAKGCVRSVDAVLLVHAHGHPHVLLLRHTPKQANARLMPSTSLRTNSTFRLPGGWCRKDEPENVAVLQKLGFDLLGEDRDGKSVLNGGAEKEASATTVDLSGSADVASVGPATGTAANYFRVGEVLGRWYRPVLDQLMYPYIPPHVPEGEVKEVRTVFLVHVAASVVFTVLQPDVDLVAVPLFELYDNVAKYGPLLASLPQELSRLNINYCK